MKFSSRSEYGLKAMTNLARSYPQRKSLSDVAKEEHISLKYLEQLIQTFRKHKLVKSYKGKLGGYMLTKDPSQLTAGEIIELIEGSIAPMKCVEKKCADRWNCPSAQVWIKVGQQIRKTLYGIKLSHLIK